MIRIHLQTGTAWTKAIEVDGSLQDDLVQLIDGYYEENGDLPVKLFTMEELMEIYDEDEIDGELEQMIPINGGEFWIDGVSHVEEI
jgi:hypothetical protein